MLNYRLLNINPRFTDSSQVNFDNLEDKKYVPVEIARNIFKEEGDLEDFKDLLESIIENGFEKIGGAQMIFKKGIDGEKYIVEGNRRYLCLLLLNGIISEAEIDNIIVPNALLKKEDKKFIINKKVIKELIGKNKCSEKFKITDDMFQDASDYDSEKIWTIINAKHAGEDKGKRKWSRIKYFFDLRFEYKKYQGQFFEEKLVIDKLAKHFNKNKKNIGIDLSSAKWVTYACDTYKQFCANNPNSEYPILDYYSDRGSAIELVLNQKFQLINDSDSSSKTLKSILKLKFENFGPPKIGYALTDEKFNKFIVEIVKLCLQEKITTRGIKEGVDMSDLIFEIFDKEIANKKRLSTQLKSKNNKVDSTFLNSVEKIIKDKTGINDMNIKILKENQDDNDKLLIFLADEYEKLIMIKNPNLYYENSYCWSYIALFLRNAIQLTLVYFENKYNLIPVKNYLKQENRQKLTEEYDSYDESQKEVFLSKNSLLKFPNYLKQDIFKKLKEYEIKYFIGNDVDKIDLSLKYANLTAIFVCIRNYYKKNFNEIMKEIDSIPDCKILELSKDNIKRYFNYIFLDLLDDYGGKYYVLNSFIHKPYYLMYENDVYQDSSDYDYNSLLEIYNMIETYLLLMGVLSKN